MVFLFSFVCSRNGMSRRTGNPLATERHIVVNMARWKPGTFYKKHLYSQKHHAHSYKSYGQQHCFHCVSMFLHCKYKKGITNLELSKFYFVT